MTILCFVDTETTGLDPRIHQPYEVCLWREDWNRPRTFYPSHTLEFADQTALKVGGYFTRGFRPTPDDSFATPASLAKHLHGVTLVGSNPAFDAAMLTRVVGTAVWHHRLINVAEGAMWLFGWDRPKGLADVTMALRDQGYEVPEPDHTAEGDVRTTRAVYDALRKECAS
jgi:hypothetical protein